MVYLARGVLTAGIDLGDRTRERTRSGARRVDEVDRGQREPFEGKEHELDELGESIGGGRA